MDNPLYMSPSPSGDDLRDDRLAYAVSDGDLSLSGRLGRSEFANLQNRRVGEFCHPVTGAAFACSVRAEKASMVFSSLGPHVDEVVGLRAEEQVPKVAADRIVAAVADGLRPVQRHGVSQLPQVTMSESRSVVADVDDTVAVLVKTASPRMAGIGARARVNSGEKPFNDRFPCAFGAHDNNLYRMALT